MKSDDMLKKMFTRQAQFMDALVEADKLPAWPIDLTTKPGQRLIKEAIWNMVEEIAEASFTLKNRVHRSTDARTLDVDHYKEELGDALAFFMEICLLSGFSAEDIYEEYCRKNAIVEKRLQDGY